MKQILFVIGSLRSNSFNRRLAQEAERIIGGRAEVRYLDYSSLPLMNQDIEFPAPEAVAQVRQQVSEADGIWIFTPEYNHSYPGHLKTLLDWLSRALKKGDFGGPTAIAGKRVTCSGVAGKSGAADSMGKLSELLSLVRAVEMKTPRCGVALTGPSFAADSLDLTEEQSDTLRRQAAAFLEFIGD